MVDQEARRKYAELVRQFISGRMTNEDYEERFEKINPRRGDHAVNEIYHQVWFLYDDIQSHRMTGKHRLDRAGRREIAKAILFLHSDQEYEWPSTAGLTLWGCLLLFVFPWAIVFMLGAFPEHSFKIVLASAVIGLLLLCHYVWLRRQTQRRWNQIGEDDAWPFQHQANLDKAKQHPRLLKGGR